jgi:hypothetical protein
MSGCSRSSSDPPVRHAPAGVVEPEKSRVEKFFAKAFGK